MSTFQGLNVEARKELGEEPALDVNTFFILISGSMVRSVTRHCIWMCSLLIAIPAIDSKLVSAGVSICVRNYAVFTACTTS
jgi:hypothetical protein